MVSSFQILLTESVFLEVHTHGLSQPHSVNLVELLCLVGSLVLLTLEHQLDELIILIEKHIDWVFPVVVVFLDVFPDPYARLLVFAKVLDWFHVLIALVILVLALEVGSCGLWLDLYLPGLSFFFHHLLFEEQFLVPELGVLGAGGGHRHRFDGHVVEATVVALVED